MKLALIRFLGVFVALVAAFGASAAEVIPPKPAQYFNDYAHVVSPAIATDLNRQLEQFERDTSSQILVAVYPKMESDSSIEDYTVRVAQSWGVGQKEKNNGAVLFVFVQDHKMYIQVGYGLEGALPDALAKQIIENEIKPHFRNGDFDWRLAGGCNGHPGGDEGRVQRHGSDGGGSIRVEPIRHTGLGHRTHHRIHHYYTPHAASQLRRRRHGVFALGTNRQLWRVWRNVGRWRFFVRWRRRVLWWRRVFGRRWIVWWRRGRGKLVRR